MKSELLYGRFKTAAMLVKELNVLIRRYFIIYWNNQGIRSANAGLSPIIKRK